MPPIAGPLDVVSLVEQARRDISAGRHELATRKLLWAFDFGPGIDSASIGVVATAVTSQLASLGQTYPPARRELLARKANIEAALRMGKPTSRESVILYDSAARALGMVADCVQTCVTLARRDDDRGGQRSAHRALLCGMVVDELLDAEMWAEATAEAPQFLGDIALLQRISSAYPGGAMASNERDRRAGRLLGAMLRLGRVEAANAFAKGAVDRIGFASTCAAMMAAARAERRPELAESIRGYALTKLDSHQRDLLEASEATQPQVFREDR